MLCQDILDLITSFVDKFDYWESLPELSAIQRLVKKSDKDLLERISQMLFLPLEFIIELQRRNRHNEPFVLALNIDPHRFKALDLILLDSMNECWQTHVVFWLFIAKTENIYHGGFTKIFENSFLFQILNVITDESLLTVSATVYLGKNGSRKAGSFFHLV